MRRSGRTDHKRVIAIVLTAGALGGFMLSTSGDAAKTPTLSVTIRSGEGKVGPNSIAEGEVKCPGGYVATGGSVSLGANEPVYDGPSSSGRGWVGAAANFGSPETYSWAIDVVCARGRGVNVKVAKVNPRLKREAIEAAKERAR